jgi:hypothetical protein
LEDGEEAHDKFYKKMKESENGEEITLWIEIYWVAKQNGTLNNFGENHNHQNFHVLLSLKSLVKELAWKEQFFNFFWRGHWKP